LTTSGKLSLYSHLTSTGKLPISTLVRPTRLSRLQRLTIIDINTWARLPLVLGFPTFAKPLIPMRQTVEVMERKLKSIQQQCGLIDASVGRSVLELMELR
jgi:hypothetical protein